MTESFSSALVTFFTFTSLDRPRIASQAPDLGLYNKEYLTRPFIVSQAPDVGLYNKEYLIRLFTASHMLDLGLYNGKEYSITKNIKRDL